LSGWMHTQSNITNIIFTWVHNTNTHKKSRTLNYWQFLKLEPALFSAFITGVYIKYIVENKISRMRFRSFKVPMSRFGIWNIFYLCSWKREFQVHEEMYVYYTIYSGETSSLFWRASQPQKVPQMILISRDCSSAIRFWQNTSFLFCPPQTVKRWLN
jgi:hypothetical protein